MGELVGDSVKRHAGGFGACGVVCGVDGLVGDDLLPGMAAVPINLSLEKKLNTLPQTGCSSKD